MGSNLSKGNMLFTEGKKLTPNLILFQTKYSTNENSKNPNPKNNEDSENNQ